MFKDIYLVRKANGLEDFLVYADSEFNAMESCKCMSGKAVKIKDLCNKDNIVFQIRKDEVK